MHIDYDILVIGLGAHGSSALYHLSKTGLKIGGIDRYAPPHMHGSSHGQSRIIRQAYHEAPFYVPLVQQAYEHWRELENISGQQLLLTTGGLMLGTIESQLIRGAKLSAETHGISFEMLDSKEIAYRFPALNPGEETIALLEKEAGILFPEKCIGAYLEQAKKQGAHLHLNEQVLSIIPQSDFVEVTTNLQVYLASRIILSAGAWINQLLPDLRLPLKIERQILYWFKNKTGASAALLPQNLPIYIWEYAASKMFYGFGDLGDGIKMALHHQGLPISPDALTDDISIEERDELIKLAASFLKIDPVFNFSKARMYTNTPDEHFIIDYLPSDLRIIVASPCSGHGFKFASVIGSILAQMATDHTPSFNLAPFAISRFL